MTAPTRILLLADTHIGFDLPVRPRTPRRRRGLDFLANYAEALAPALAGAVDVVVHGGDVFDRADVTPEVAWRALEPLSRIADMGVPVLVVPGNHERSRLPHERFAAHPHVHIFDVPRTVVLRVRGSDIAFAGFPSERRVRERFAGLLERTGWREADATVRLLCMHQCAEGATVGPGNFMFRDADDVVRVSDVPREFAAVLSGHIHRHQALTRDLHGHALATPVLYPGSIERASAAEAGEPKGFMLVNVAPAAGVPVQWEFRALATRPMVVREVSVAGLDDTAADTTLRAVIESAPADAVLRIRVRGDDSHLSARTLSAARLRALAPATMNVEVATEARTRRFLERRTRREVRTEPPGPNLELEL
jgi:DNA repair protein SbcD/Mre11